MCYFMPFDLAKNQRIPQGNVKSKLDVFAANFSLLSISTIKSDNNLN